MCIKAPSSEERAGDWYYSTHDSSYFSSEYTFKNKGQHVVFINLCILTIPGPLTEVTLIEFVGYCIVKNWPWLYVIFPSHKIIGSPVWYHVWMIWLFPIILIILGWPSVSSPPFLPPPPHTGDMKWETAPPHTGDIKFDLPPPRWEEFWVVRSDYKYWVQRKGSSVLTCGHTDLWPLWFSLIIIIINSPQLSPRVSLAPCWAMALLDLPPRLTTMRTIWLSGLKTGCSPWVGSLWE